MSTEFSGFFKENKLEFVPHYFIRTSNIHLTDEKFSSTTHHAKHEVCSHVQSHC